MSSVKFSSHLEGSTRDPYDDGARREDVCLNCMSSNIRLVVLECREYTKGIRGLTGIALSFPWLGGILHVWPTFSKVVKMAEIP